MALLACGGNDVSRRAGRADAAGDTGSGGMAPGGAGASASTAGAASPLPDTQARSADTQPRRSRVEPAVATPVNRGSHGMFARVRWTLSPDRRTILVVEDPAAVENEPVPNGFVMAGEDGMRLVQVDSAWDVAPSPDWRRAGFGRAYRVHSSEADTAIPPAALASLAARLGMSARDVRTGSFPISAMAYMWGFAQPGVIDLAGDRKLFRLAAGWRVAWSVDGSRLVAGTGPRQRAMDDAPAERWIALDPRDGMPSGEVPAAARLAQVTWTEGPLIDISVPLDTATRVSLPIDGGSVESSGGRIRVNGRDIGPGVALAATRGGRFIAALAPDPEAGEYEPKHRLVIYTVLP